MWKKRRRIYSLFVGRSISNAAKSETVFSVFSSLVYHFFASIECKKESEKNKKNENIRSLHKNVQAIATPAAAATATVAVNGST